MANTNRKKNKNDKLSTGKRKKTMRLEEVEELKILPPDERIEYLIEHGHLIKDKLFNTVALRKGNFNKEALVLKPNKLASKNGTLKNRNKHIKYLDSILMSELLISQPNTQAKTKPGDNNNDTDLSDQNNSDSSKNKPNITKTAKKSEETNNIQNNDEVIEISIDTNDPISAEQTEPNETKKARKQTQKSRSNNKNNDVIEMTVDANHPSEVDPTNSTNVAKKAKCKNKDSKILAQRLERMKKVKLSNGFSLSLTYYQCDHCLSKFSSKFILQRHMLVHSVKIPYSCSHCLNGKFSNRGNLRRHMAHTHPEAFEKVKYECRVCKKPFMLLKHLKLHQKEHADEKLKRHTCVFCEKGFKSQLLLAKHEKYHMAPGRYKCGTCSMSYDSLTLYADHLKSHSQRDFSCQFCGKSYLRPGSVTRHIRVSHGGMRMQCPVCNKLLKGHLSEHMRTHENQRPHECDVCGQRFTQSTQLTVHKRSHTGDRPYPCRICKQPFSHSNALMLHIRRHTGEKPFECAMCPQTFSQLPHMKAHMRSIHNKTEFYKCNNCNNFFKLKSLLEAHAEECGEAGSVQKKDKGADTLVSRMRFLLALLFTMIASKEKLNDLGFNKRLIDDILVDSIEAMGLTPCKDAALAALPRLQSNALLLLQGTVPKQQMALFVKENKSIEEILGLLTDDLTKK